jgi:hypothetical protein
LQAGPKAQSDQYGKLKANTLPADWPGSGNDQFASTFFQGFPKFGEDDLGRLAEQNKTEM